MRRIAIIVLVVTMLGALAAAVAVVTFDWNRARPWVEQAVTEAIGRTVTIGGDLEPRFSLVPTVRAHEVRVGTSLEPHAASLAEFDLLEVRFPLRPLVFDRRFELYRVSARDGRLRIADGTPSAAGSSPSLGWLDSLPREIHVANVRIVTGAVPSREDELVVEHATVGRCGERVEIEARLERVPLSLAGTLSCRQPDRVGLSRFEASLGESTVAGSFEVDLGGERPTLSAQLVGSDLHAGDLAGLAPAGDGETRDVQDVVLPFDQLAVLDMDVTVADSEIRLSGSRDGSLSDFRGRLRTKAGTLDLQIDKATLWDGALAAWLQTEGPDADPRVTLEASLRGASVAHFFTDGGAKGRFDSSLEVESRGVTLRELLAGATGKMRASHGEVVFETSPLGPLGRDLLDLVFVKRSSGRIRCMVARTSLENGQGALALVADTPDTTIAGMGELDLQKQRIKMVLRPRPRRASVGALKLPVLVSGPLSSPKAHVARGALLDDVRDATLSSVLNPFILVSPLVDLGTGPGNPCEHALEAATIEVLRHKKGLQENDKMIGKGRRWLDRILDHSPPTEPSR